MEGLRSIFLFENPRYLTGIISEQDLFRGQANYGPLELWT